MIFITNIVLYITGSPKKHSCDIILKQGHWLRRNYRLNFFFFFFFVRSGEHFFSGSKLLNKFGRMSSKKHFSEIILKSGNRLGEDVI